MNAKHIQNLISVFQFPSMNSPKFSKFKWKISIQIPPKIRNLTKKILLFISIPISSIQIIILDSVSSSNPIQISWCNIPQIMISKFGSNTKHLSLNPSHFYEFKIWNRISFQLFTLPVKSEFAKASNSTLHVCGPCMEMAYVLSS